MTNHSWVINLDAHPENIHRTQLNRALHHNDRLTISGLYTTGITGITVNNWPSYNSESFNWSRLDKSLTKNYSDPQFKASPQILVIFE